MAVGRLTAAAATRRSDDLEGARGGRPGRVRLHRGGRHRLRHEPETVEKIFDPFFSTKFTGCGLGLSTVLGIVRGHRGALAVRSTPGRGTTFRIFLPCGGGVEVAQPAPETAAPPPVATGARTVLLVDDEEDVRIVTQQMLRAISRT
jgi:hypothetical protein